MQSSSELFPVALISAELRGDLSEDVYRLKPGNSPDSSVELALTRLGRAGHEQVRGVPVILIPGSFSNRRFWYSPKCIGLGPYLARAGFDVWIAEMRGHGLSPRCVVMVCRRVTATTHATRSVTTYAMTCRQLLILFMSRIRRRPIGWGTP